MKVEYHVQILDEALPIIKKYLEPLLWLVPTWCQDLIVIWQQDKDNSSCAFSIDYEYRRATLYVYPMFLMGDEDTRRTDMLHELLHGFAGILADYAASELKTLLPKEESPKYRASVLRELNMRHESWVQDMAYCIHKHLMTPPKPAE